MAAKAKTTTKKEKDWFDLCNGVRIDAVRLNRAVEKNGKIVAKAQKKTGLLVSDVPSLYSKKNDADGKKDAAGKIKQVNDKLLFKNLDEVNDPAIKAAVTGALNLLLAGKL